MRRSLPVRRPEFPGAEQVPTRHGWSAPLPILMTLLAFTGLLSLSGFAAEADTQVQWKRRDPAASARVQSQRHSAALARTPSVPTAPVRKVAAQTDNPDLRESAGADRALAAPRRSQFRSGSVPILSARHAVAPRDLTDPPLPRTDLAVPGTDPPLPGADPPSRHNQDDVVDAEDHAKELRSRDVPPEQPPAGEADEIAEDAPASQNSADTSAEFLSGSEDWNTDARLREKQLHYRKLTEQVRGLINAWNAAARAPTVPPAASPENSGPPPAASAATDPSTAADRDAKTPDVVSITDPVNGPIDRLALANNLYTIREFVLSLELYEQIDQTSLSGEDKVWIEYQIAGCLRKLKRTGDAQQRYRRIAGQPDAGWLHELSRWWLERMVLRDELENEIRQFDSVLAGLKEKKDVRAVQ